MIDHIVHSYSVDFYVHIILINTHIKEGTKKIVSNLAAKKQTFHVYAKIYKSFHFIKGTQYNRIVRRVSAIIISICVTGGREIDITKKIKKYKKSEKNNKWRHINMILIFFFCVYAKKPHMCHFLCRCDFCTRHILLFPEVS